ncbi:hypothetical protein [Methylibium petroleiphilum]
MAIASSDIKQRLSGGAANSNANASIGGAKSSNDAPSNLFDDVDSSETAAGDTEYRCVYIHNNHGSLTLQNAVLWISSNTSGNRIAVALGAAALNATETAVANESTAPSGPTFSQPTTKGGGISLGSIPAGQHRAIWIRRTVAAAAAAAADAYTLRVEGDTAA